MDIVSLILSFVGAGAWLPYILEKLKKSKIEGKILKYSVLTNGSYYKPIPFECDSGETIQGTIFLVRFRLISLHRDFHINDVSVKVKFKSKTCEYDTNAYFCDDVTMSGEKHKLKQEDSLLMCPVLLKNSTNDLDIQFIVKCSCSDIEYMDLYLKDYRNKAKIVRFKQPDFNNAIKYL